MPSLTQRAAPSPYRLKQSPYSSHGLLLRTLPGEGAGRRVLDLGCGAGYIAELLARRGYSVTGVEITGRAPEGFPQAVECIHADLDLGMPPLAGRFDYILCADVLEHLRTPWTVLEELHTLLAPGGRIVASLPNSGHAWFRANVVLGRFPSQDCGLFDRTHLHFYTWHGWVELFSQAGFRMETLRCSAVPLGLLLPRWEHTWAVHLLERLSFVAARLWKTLLAYQFIVTARPEEPR